MTACSVIMRFIGSFPVVVTLALLIHALVSRYLTLLKLMHASELHLGFGFEIFINLIFLPSGWLWLDFDC